MPEEAVQEVQETTTEVQEPTMESVEVFPPNPIKDEPAPVEEKTVENTDPKPEENAVEDPAEKKEDVPDLFAENSKTAFNSEDGSFDSEKLTSHIEEKDSFYDKLVFEPMETSNEIDAENDPEVQYRDNILNIADTFEDILEEEAGFEHTAEQTLQRLKEHFAAQKSTRDNLINENKRLDSRLAKHTASLNAAMEQKIDARIETVTNRIAPRFEGLIPGMSGEQVMNKFALDPKLGGQYLKSLFNRENKDLGKMTPEEQKQVTSKWQRAIQTSGKDMAMAAKVGEALWYMENLPNMLQNAVQIGAGRANTQRNATFNSKVKPNNGTKQTTNLHPQLAGFFGRSVE